MVNLPPDRVAELLEIRREFGQEIVLDFVRDDGNVSRSLESLLANEDAGLVRLLCNKAKGITPSEVRASLKRAKIRIDFPVPTLAGASPLSTMGIRRQGCATPGSVSIRRQAGQKT